MPSVIFGSLLLGVWSLFSAAFFFSTVDMQQNVVSLSSHKNNDLFWTGKPLRFKSIILCAYGTVAESFGPLLLYHKNVQRMTAVDIPVKENATITCQIWISYAAKQQKREGNCSSKLSALVKVMYF